MTRPAIYIATPDAAEYQKLLTDALGADVPMTLATTRQEAIDAYAGQAVLLARPDFAAAILASRPAPGWVQSTWAGVTPLLAVPFRDYLLTGVKDVFGPQMAEYVLGYLLAHELGLAARLDRQREKRWDAFRSGRLRGKTLGVMGTGSIGAAIGAAASLLGLRVLGYNSGGSATPPFELVYHRQSLNTFLKQCDYLVGVLPDLPATTGLIDVAAIAAMKPDAVLINVGRGNLIDEKALCQALSEGRLGAAVLDVFREEPLPEKSPLWDTPGLTITPHVAAVSEPPDIAALFVDNYRRFERGESLRHLVDFEKGY